MLKFEKWSPGEDDRLKAYRFYEQLYRSEHHSAFADRVNQSLYKMGGDKLTFLALDYPRTIVNVPANLLVGLSPVISYTEPALNDALKRVMTRSKFETVELEVAQGVGFRGDGVMEARIGSKGVVIEPKPAYSYFPQLNPDNCRDVLSEQLAWERIWQGDKILRIDHYLPGEIVREAYRLGNGGKVGRPYSGSELEAILGGPQVLSTGLISQHPINTLVHVPNYRGDNSFFGESDLGGGLPTLFEEVDERLSQISRILDKHADPKMTGPKLNVSPDGVAKMLELGYIEVGPNHEAPSYLTWDAQLIAAFSHYKACCDEIFRHSEISPALAGFVQGARYDSGRAYRMMLAPTLAKVSRKRIYLDPALKEILRIAVAMELGANLDGIEPPNVRWRDGLPKDTAQDSQTENNRIASKTSSRLSSIRRLDDCDEATALAELERIRREQSEFGDIEMPPQITPNDDDASDELAKSKGSEGEDA